MDIALLEVVVVDLDRARKGVGLGVYLPRSLPLTAPKVAEIRVDATNVDLQVAILIEAKSCPSSS